MEKIKILYVDDEQLNLMLLKLNLRGKYDVIIANSAAEGLKLLESESNIAVVISDMKMPNVSGIEFIEQAKKKYTEIKYFILTGLDITPEIEEAIQSGLILDYFNKPFKPDEIEKSISDAFAND